MTNRCRMLGLVLLLLSPAARAVQFSTEKIGEIPVTVARVDVRKEKLELFLRDKAGAPLRRLSRLATLVESHGRRLVFGINGGMYERDLSSVGLFVSESRQLKPLHTANGWGNFCLKPNGVFAVTAEGARVIETSEFPKLRERVLLATQSGPLLVWRGKLHPAFQEGSASRLYRDGVGIGPQGEAVFAITGGPVNFYDFASFFRDTLKCRDALFLDGTICSIYAPALRRSDSLMDLGPMLGVSE